MLYIIYECNKIIFTEQNVIHSQFNKRKENEKVDKFKTQIFHIYNYQKLLILEVYIHLQITFNKRHAVKINKKDDENLLQLIIYTHVIYITNIILSRFNRHKESYSILQYSINIVYITRYFIHFKIIYNYIKLSL